MPATVEGRPTERNARGKAPEGGWQAGQLVEARSRYQDAITVGRLMRAPRNGEAGLMLTATTVPWYVETSGMRYLSSTPADDPAPSLQTRRKNLLRNLEEARIRLYGKLTPLGRTHSNLIYALHDTIANYDRHGAHSWFWQTLAESADNPRQVSYAATIEEVDNNARRKRCSWKKLLERARAFGSPFLPEDEAVIANLIGQQFPANYDFSFEVVSGKEVMAAYANPTPAWGSCMHGLPYPNFYAINPERVSVVRISQGNKPAGRALLWTADDGSRIVDRCYPSDGGAQMIALHAWASEQGYDYKVDQNYRPAGLKSGRDDYKITMKTHAPGYDARRKGYPFLDTFKYAPEHPSESDVLTLSMQRDKTTLESTSGRWEYDRSSFSSSSGSSPALMYWGDNDDDNDDDNDEEEEVSCNWCGNGVGDGDPLTDSNGYQYCEPCFAQHVLRVDYTYNGVHIAGLYPENTVSACRDCGQQRFNRHMRQVAGEGYFCPACLANQETGECPICEVLAMRADLTRGCCINCYPLSTCSCATCERTRRRLGLDSLVTTNQR